MAKCIECGAASANVMCKKCASSWIREQEEIYQEKESLDRLEEMDDKNRPSRFESDFEINQY